MVPSARSDKELNYAIQLAGLNIIHSNEFNTVHGDELM